MNSNLLSHNWKKRMPLSCKKRFLAYYLLILAFSLEMLMLIFRLNFAGCQPEAKVRAGVYFSTSVLCG